MQRPVPPARVAADTSHRLFTGHPLAPGAAAPLDSAQSNYLLNVLRLPDGAGLLVFNGRDGEFRARLSLVSRKSALLVIDAQTRAQPAPSALTYMFAPLKHARLDYMVQKAVEMGAGCLAPVITQRTQTARVNLERMRANAIEAAEQCGLLGLPEILPERPLLRVLDGWPQDARLKDSLLVFCDEAAPIADPLAALQGRAEQGRQGVTVLIGPEGGFDAAERAALLALPQALRLSLGPRILRADTAAVAALALVQAALGDFRLR